MSPSDRDRDDLRDGVFASANGPTHASGAPGDDGWLRSAIEHSTEVVKIVALDGTLRYASPAFERLFGHDREEAVGTNVLDLVHPEDLAHVLEQTEKALSKGDAGANVAEYRFRHADGSWRWVESVGTYLLDDPAVGGVVVTVRDVTERKRAERELGSLRREYEELLGSVEAIIWKGEARTLRFTFVSDQAEAILGYPARRWTQEPLFWQEHIHPEDREWAVSYCRRAVAEKKDHDFEYRMISAEGDVVWLRDIVRVGLEDGVPAQLFGVMVDVTGRKKAEEDLRESQERYRAVVAQSVEAIYLYDAETKRILESNAAFRTLVDYTAEELLGMRIYDFIAHDDEDIDRNVRRSLKERQRHIGERRYRRRDGSELLVDTSASVISYGGRTALCAVSRDVTERSSAEERTRRSEARLREAQRLAHLGGWEWDVRSGEISWSDEVYRIYGLAPQAFVPNFERFMKVVHPDDRELLSRTIDEALPGHKPYDVEHRVVRPDGEVRVVHRRAEVVRGEENEPLRMIGTVHDITERKEAEQLLMEAEERYRTVVEEQTELVCRFLPDLTLTFVNDAYCRYFGGEPEELVGDNFLEHIPAEDRAHYEGPSFRLSPERPTRTVEHRVLTPGGEVRWQQWTDTAVFDGDGRVTEYQSVGRDVTERRALEDRLEHQALHDFLTGLPNRRLFEDRLGQALERTGGRGRAGVAVLFLDLADFKVVNDSLGHKAGDLLLVVVAERLRRCLPPEATLARLGGDEFVVLIEGVEGAAGATRVAGWITEELRRPFVLEGRELFVSANVGIALGDARTKSPEDLFRDADTAMYRAKEEGSAYGVFDPAMRERVVGRLKAENDLRRAIERGEFVVHYQPIVELREGRVREVEALVRWDHPDRGLLNPGEFVPLAEESGLIIPLGEQVLGEACRQGGEWHAEHPRIPPLAVSVNLSARQLSRPDLAETVERTLGQTGLEANLLTLDVTETVYVKALEGNTVSLDRLRKMGVRISIDDFGTGYSSLSYLKRLPADALKIDKSFVKGLGEDIEDTAIVRMVIELAHTLGMEVIAEGVETWAQATLLAEMGCDLGQGFHFSRPLPPEAAAQFLAE